MSMRTTIELGSADLLIATQANIFPRTFSVGAPHVVVTSTPGSVRPIAITVSNPLRFTPIWAIRPLRYFVFSASALEVYPAASQTFHFSIALTLPSQPPSAGFTNVPSASLAHPRPPPGRPSLIGQYETVTVAPGSNVLPVIPRSQQRRRRRALEAPERFAAVRILDIQIEPRVRGIECPASDGAGRDFLDAPVEHRERVVGHGGRRRQQAMRPGRRSATGTSSSFPAPSRSEAWCCRSDRATAPAAPERASCPARP